MNRAIPGLMLLVAAGAMNASFTLPMKYARRWAWENTWLAWTMFALIALPVIVTFSSVPHLGEVYCSTGARTILEVFVFGAGWGIAQVFFGLAVDAIGIALAFSLVLGTSAAVGAMIPLLRLNPGSLKTTAGHNLLIGVALVIVGVLVCATSGRQREEALMLRSKSQKSSTLGFLLAICCGFGAAFVNFGLVFGAPLIQTARSLGTNRLTASNVVWMPLMLAGAVPNLLYCLWLLRKNQTSHNFTKDASSHWLLAFVMAVLWFGSTLLYGLSTIKLDAWGAILGWPLFMSLIVITASLIGMLTGEWRDSGVLPLMIQWSGVALLILAVFVLASTSRSLS